jgi:DNA primase
MGDFIPSATLEQIRAASDIVDVIGASIPLKRAGANFVALCPFHREKSPSFNVNPHKQIFHCFGCHKGGDVFTFVKEYESIDFPDAVRRLAERARIPLDFENQPGQSQNRHLKDQLLQIHEQITQRWQTALEKDPAAQIARDYLERRGVSPDAVKLFRLGYAPDLWDDTVNWSKSKHLDLPVVEQAGLIIRKEGADHFYDRFRGRLIFPICDEQGRVIGFSGRILSGDEKSAKYVNSPESPIFTKGKVLFALDKAKRSILDVGYAVICEGQIDTIACHMRGITNVIAPQGTALTLDQIRILKRYTKDLILCFDGDNAGKKAAARAYDEVLKAGMPFRIASIPPPDDPDSFMNKFGREALLDIIVRAEEFHEFYLRYLCSNHKMETMAGADSIVRAMAEAASKISSEDASLQIFHIEKYAQKTAQRLGVSVDAIRSAFDKTIRRPIRSDDDAEIVVPQSDPSPRPSEAESYLLRIALETDDFIDWIAAHLDPEWCAHPHVRAVITHRIDAHFTGSWSGVAAWLSASDNAAWSSLITEILADGRPIADPETVLKGSPTRQGAVKILRDKFIDRQLAACNQRLADPALPQADQTALIQQTQSLRLLKKQPLVPKSDAA